MGSIDVCPDTICSPLRCLSRDGGNHSGALMQVLHVCSELFPLLKTGGLADVACALPAAQIAGGTDVRVLIPAFPDIKRGIGDTQVVGHLDTFRSEEHTSELQSHS